MINTVFVKCNTQYGCITVLLQRQFISNHLDLYPRSPQSIFSDLRLYLITSCYFWPDLSWIKKNGVYTIIMIQHQILLGLTNDCHFIGWQEAHRPSHALCETLYSLKSRSTPNYSPTIANISSPSPWTQKLTFGSLGMYQYILTMYIHVKIQE